VPELMGDNRGFNVKISSPFSASAQLNFLWGSSPCSGLVNDEMEYFWTRKADLKRLL